MRTFSDVVSGWRRRLENEIKELNNAKFSTHEELTNRDSIVAQKRNQLGRVQVAQIAFNDGLPFCPKCFILHGENNPCMSIYSESADKENAESFRCPECDTVIDVPS